MLLTVRNSGCRSVKFRSATFQISKNPSGSCLTVVSPRGSNEAKDTAGMNVFCSYQSNAIFWGEAVDLNNGNQSNDK